MHRVFHRWRLPILIGAVVVFLVVKYFWSLALFPDVPFGYDAGIYRYLFIRFAEALPPFSYPAMPAWSMGHAPGLFFFTSILVNAGVTPDMLIGFLWNLVPVVLAAVLAQAVRKRHGQLAGVFTLVAVLLSTVQYEGFLMIYYKVFIALVWCVLAFSAFEKRSWLWIPFGMLSIATHQQIGLVFVAAIGSSLVSTVAFQKKKFPWRTAGEFLFTIVLGLSWYAPTYEQSLGAIVPRLLHSGTMLGLAVAVAVICGFSAVVIMLPNKNRRLLWILCALGCGVLVALLPVVIDSPAAPGAFLGIADYLKLSLPLLLAGITGLVLSVEKGRGTPWQWAAVWCAVAALGMFFFYRRFLLPLDFFLLPFAGIAFAALWNSGKKGRIVLAVLLLMQSGLLVNRMRAIDPHVKPELLAEIARLEDYVAEHDQVVVLDTMAPWVLGYLPVNTVTGPGIFDSRPLPEWEKFLLGSPDDRRRFIEEYPIRTYFYATDIFFSYYPPAVTDVVLHPCLTPVPPIKGLYRSSCGR